MCARAGENKLKTSARRTLARADALYLSAIDGADRRTTIERFEKWRAALANGLNLNGMTVFTSGEIQQLVDYIDRIAGQRLIAGGMPAVRRQDAGAP